MKNSHSFLSYLAVMQSAFVLGANCFCLTDRQATTVGNNFAQLTSNYSTALADNALYSAFSDQTDSVATLIDSASGEPIPLGSLTFPSKSFYESMQGNQPPIPFQILNNWHTCDTVIIRWVSKQTPQQVQGITIMQVAANPDASAAAQFKYQINTTYAEFNSGSWLVNLGNPQCANSTAR